jgi:hypothetical protein
MRNRIDLVLYEIVALTGNKKVKPELQEQIAVQCEVSVKSVYRWLSNANQPSTAQLVLILEILKAYKPEMQLEDLLETTPSQIQKKFGLIK